MNTYNSKTNSLLLSLFVLCTNFCSITALSLHDLTKRPSLEIVGTKILHNGKRIIVGIGDITKIEGIDAIVNAANNRLIFGSGIAGSISLALGLQGVAQVYRDIKKKYSTPVPVGSAPITQIPANTELAHTGFKYLIQAVGPDCRVADQEAIWPDLLHVAYQNTLNATKGKDIHSIIIPPLSTGIFGCPQDDALVVMMDTIVDSLKHDTELKTLQEVILVVWSGSKDAQETAQEWLRALNNAIDNQDSDYKTLVGASTTNT